MITFKEWKPVAGVEIKDKNSAEWIQEVYKIYLSLMENVPEVKKQFSFRWEESRLLRKKANDEIKAPDLTKVINNMLRHT